MLTQVTEGVLIHQSELLQNNAVVVEGRAGALLIDPGIRDSEMICLANDLRELSQPVVAGFSTHPDWDHVLWHAELGEAPRYGTARCAAYMRDLLSDAGWKARVAEGLPPEIADEVSLDLFGLIIGLPAETTHLPWDGPDVRIVEHPAHAPGHAALLIEERRVLVAGDMAAAARGRGRPGRCPHPRPWILLRNCSGTRTDRPGPRICPRLAWRQCFGRPADRPIGQARLGMGTRHTRRASSALRAKKRARRDTLKRHTFAMNQRLGLTRAFSDPPGGRVAGRASPWRRDLETSRPGGERDHARLRRRAMATRAPAHPQSKTDQQMSFRNR